MWEDTVIASFRISVRESKVTSLHVTDTNGELFHHYHVKSGFTLATTTVVHWEHSVCFRVTYEPPGDKFPSDEVHLSFYIVYRS